MRIFNSSAGDPMLLDRADGLRSLSAELRRFIQTANPAQSFAAEVAGNPAPYAEFLRGLRIEKVGAGAPQLRITEDRWLELKATVAELEGVCEKLERTQDGSHTHLYAVPASLIFEADDSWAGFHEG
jgi:hypothetical protein